MITVHQITGLGEVPSGADLAALLAAGIRRLEIALTGRETLVVTQKIVSKSENRLVSLTSVTPGGEALRLAKITGKDPRLVELVLAESVAIVRAAPNVLIARHHSGHVMANAGIDHSNSGCGDAQTVLLLPQDADASAARLRDGLMAHGMPEMPVLISDSFGRPWRYGVVNVAIGAAGFPALVDRRGVLDRDGRRLEVTQVALGDMVAAAAGLAMGEAAESVPAALLTGLTLPSGELPATRLVRALEEDLFR